MPKPLDPRVLEILKQYGEDPKTSVWDVRGAAWVVYHRVLERIAQKAGITFSEPKVLNCTDSEVALYIQGSMTLDNGHVLTWGDVGEASIKNNKNEYRWAMSMKRAQDRVILKLLGLHGFVYSEEEADDFKESAKARDAVAVNATVPSTPTSSPTASSSSAAAEIIAEIRREMQAATDMQDIEDIAAKYRDRIATLPVSQRAVAGALKKSHIERIQALQPTG